MSSCINVLRRQGISRASAPVRLLTNRAARPPATARATLEAQAVRQESSFTKSPLGATEQHGESLHRRISHSLSHWHRTSQRSPCTWFPSNCSDTWHVRSPWSHDPSGHWYVTCKSVDEKHLDATKRRFSLIQHLCASKSLECIAPSAQGTVLLWSGSASGNSQPLASRGAPQCLSWNNPSLDPRI